MRRGYATAALVAGAVVAGAVTAAPTLAAHTGMPCHPRWGYVAYHPGGRPVRLPASVSRPVVCATSTGYAASESTIAVTRRGTVVFSPAHTENSLARSTDGGASWSLSYPADEQYTSFWNTVDPYVIADPRTGRLFWAHATGPVRTEGTLPRGLGFYLAAASGFQVYTSRDEGRTFTTADYSTAPTGDWEKVFVGPPRPASTGAPQPTGYPDVVYLCANSPLEVVGPGRICYRSLDGGATFAPAGYVSPAPSEPQDVCPPLGADNAVVDPTGVIYLPFTCRNAGYLVTSDDEGVSWTWRRVPLAPGGSVVPDPAGRLQVAIDHAGDLYALWNHADRLYLTVSRDHARSWSTPRPVTPARLHGVVYPVITATGRGRLGVVYYASTSHRAGKLSAYATLTANALSSGPLLCTTVLNDPNRPIFRDYGLAVSPRLDFIGATFDRRGDLWAGVVKQIGRPDADNHVRTTGWVARVAGLR